MAIETYRRKPRPTSQDFVTAARYEPGQPLDDFTAVADKAMVIGFAMAEVDMPAAGGTVLLVRWVDTDHGAHEEFRTLTRGRYLATSPPVDLYVTDQADLDQWYERVAL